MSIAGKMYPAPLGGWFGEGWRELQRYYDEQDKVVDLTREDQMATSNGKRDDARHKDLDETRRLLYLVLAAPRTKKYNLVGTLVHALKHHQGSERDAGDLLEAVTHLVEGDASDDEIAWAQEQIGRLSRELG